MKMTSVAKVETNTMYPYILLFLFIFVAVFWFFQVSFSFLKLFEIKMYSDHFSPITVVSYILSKAKLTEEGQTFKDRIQHFDNDLIRIFVTQRDFSAGTNLSRNEKRLLKQKYLELKNPRRSKTFVFFEQLRDCGDLATIEKVFKFLKEIEVHYHQYSDQDRIHNCVMDTFRDNPTLNAWVMDHYKQGLGYKVRKFFLTNFPKPPQLWIEFSNFLPWITLMPLVLLIYINIWKDVIIFSELMHYCNVILVSVS